MTGRKKPHLINFCAQLSEDYVSNKITVGLHDSLIFNNFICQCERYIKYKIYYECYRCIDEAQMVYILTVQIDFTVRKL